MFWKIQNIVFKRNLITFVFSKKGIKVIIEITIMADVMFINI